MALARWGLNYWGAANRERGDFSFSLSISRWGWDKGDGALLPEGQGVLREPQRSSVLSRILMYPPGSWSTLNILEEKQWECLFSRQKVHLRDLAWTYNEIIENGIRLNPVRSLYPKGSNGLISLKKTKLIHQSTGSYLSGHCCLYDLISCMFLLILSILGILVSLMFYRHST